MRKNVPVLVFIIIIFQSFISNAQWVRTHGPMGGNIHCFAFYDTTIFIGTNLGVYSSNNADNWYPQNNGLLNSSVLFLTVDGQKIFAGTEGGIYFSTNLGQSWSELNNSLSNDTVKSILLNNSKIFLGTFGKGVLQSDNNGISWVQSNTGLTDLYINTLFIDDNKIYAGTNSEGIFISSDWGLTWSGVTTDLSGICITAFTKNGNNLFACTSNNGILKSSNFGQNWASANNGLTDLKVWSVLSNGNKIFVGTESGGVFLSNDNGQNWAAFNTGFSFPSPIYSLATDGIYLFAGTAGDRVWKRYGSGLVKISDVIYENDFKILPNPANNKLQIFFENNNDKKVNIYNIHGLLLKKIQLTGPRAIIDITDLQSGLYLIEINNDNIICTKRFIKL